MADFLKIIRAEIKNFQSLEHKQIDLGGKSIAIIGRNGGGKSSLLRAIQSPINAQSIPSKAIKDGEERASVKIELAGEKDGEKAFYNYHLVFNAKSKKGKLSVTDAEGNKIESRDIQRQLIGDVSFDVDKFIRLGLTDSGKISKPGIQEQIEMMMTFLTPEERKEIMGIDKAYAQVEEQRKIDKKEANRLETLIKDNAMSEEDMEKYSVDRSEEKTSLESKMSKLGEAIKEYNSMLSKKETLDRKLNTIKNEFKDAKKIIEINQHHDLVVMYSKFKDIEHPFAEEIKKIVDYITRYNSAKSEAKDYIDEGAKIDEWLKNNPEPSIESINEELNTINQHQKMHEVVKGIKEDWSKVVSLRKGVDNMTEQLKKLKQAKKELFANSNLPVKGLEFNDEDGITYEGLPFNQDHIETSKIIAIGVRIAMGLNPNLKVIFIKDGSMFDKKTLKWLLKTVEKEGFQLFIEMVDWTGEKEVEVQFTEDFVD